MMLMPSSAALIIDASSDSAIHKILFILILVMVASLYSSNFLHSLIYLSIDKYYAIYTGDLILMGLIVRLVVSFL